MTCKDGRFNTGNKLCSNDLRDLNDDIIIVDGYVNSREHLIEDRLGTERLTLAGIEASVEDRIGGIIQQADGIEVVNEFGNSEYKVLNQNIVSKYLLYTSKQAKLFSKFLMKLKVDGGTTINCIGTSNTSNNWGTNGYPYFLGETLTNVYGNEVTINNLGFSGGTVEYLFNKWKDNTPPADIAIMEWTGNDSGRTDIDVFIANIEKYIEFELDNDRAVMLITSPKTTHTDNIKRDIYMQSMFQIARRYGVPIIDNENNLKNCDPSFYHDRIHLNEKGNKYAAHRIAAALVGETILNPKVVEVGTTLLSRQTIDSIVYSSNAINYKSAGKPVTPVEDWGSDLGISGSLRGQNGRAVVYYSFYANTDDLWAMPFMRVDAGAKVRVTVNSEGAAPQANLKISKRYGGDSLYSESNVFEFENNTNDSIMLNSDGVNKMLVPLIVNGWHLLRIEVFNSLSILYGIEFDLLKVTKESASGNIVMGIGTLSGTKDVESTEIDFSDLSESFGIDINTALPYMNPVFKVSWVEASYSYSVLIKARSTSSGGWYFVGEKIVNFGAPEPSSKSRGISGIETTDKSIIIKWGDNIARHGSMTVTLL